MRSGDHILFSLLSLKHFMEAVKNRLEGLTTGRTVCFPRTAQLSVSPNGTQSYDDISFRSK